MVYQKVNARQSDEISQYSVLSAALGGAASPIWLGGFVDAAFSRLASIAGRVGPAPDDEADERGSGKSAPVSIWQIYPHF